MVLLAKLWNKQPDTHLFGDQTQGENSFCQTTLDPNLISDLSQTNLQLSSAQLRLPSG